MNERTKTTGLADAGRRRAGLATLEGTRGPQYATLRPGKQHSSLFLPHRRPTAHIPLDGRTGALITAELLFQSEDEKSGGDVETSRGVDEVALLTLVLVAERVRKEKKRLVQVLARTEIIRRFRALYIPHYLSFVLCDFIRDFAIFM